MKPEDELGIIDAGGVDEVSVIPWGRLVRHRVANRIGLTRRVATLVVLLGSVFTVSFTITLLVVSLRTVADDLGSTVSVMSWTITAPLLAFGVVGPAFGKAGDLWGHKRVFVGGLALAGVFSLASALAWDPLSLIAMRTLAAASGAATGPSAMAYINRLYGPDERMRPLGLWSFVTAGAPVVGVVAGAPLVEAFGWRVIFLAQAPLCLVAALVARTRLRETERATDVRFDVLGSFTLGVGVGLVLLAVNRGNAWGWLAPATLAAAAIGVAFLVWFVVVERRADDPLLPLRWLRTRNIAAPIATIGLLNLGYMGSFILVPQLLESGLGYSPSRVGALIIARPLMFSLVAPMAIYVVARVGERRAGVGGALVSAVALLVMMAVRTPGQDWVVIVGLALTGLGMGVAAPTLTALLASSVPTADMGVASAVQQLGAQLGAVFGGALMVAVQDVAASSGSLSSYSWGLAVGVAASLVAAVTAIQVRGGTLTR